MKETILQNNKDKIARQIAHAPSLNDLPDASYKTVAKAVLFKSYVDELETLVKAYKVDYQKEKEVFLSSYKSVYTKKNYTAGIKSLEVFLESFPDRKNILLLTPEDADDFIKSLLENHETSASILLKTASISSFFSFIERRHTFIKNPFRGTRLRPSPLNKKKIEVPLKKEVTYLLSNTPPLLASCIAVMAYRGLRSGSLPSLSIDKFTFETVSKGKRINGTLPAVCLEYIRKANPEKIEKPFENLSDTKIENQTLYWTRKFFKKGILPSSFSAHDFRHFYAVSEYEKDKDIYRVSKMLYHSSIAVTERYLRSISVIL